MTEAQSKPINNIQLRARHHAHVARVKHARARERDAGCWAVGVGRGKCRLFAVPPKSPRRRRRWQHLNNEIGKTKKLIGKQRRERIRELILKIRLPPKQQEKRFSFTFRVSLPVCGSEALSCNPSLFTRQQHLPKRRGNRPHTAARTFSRQQLSACERGGRLRRRRRWCSSR
jgi:hypothetical protein